MGTMKHTAISYTLSVLLTLIFLFSCKQNTNQSLLPELNQAEAIMYEYPDTALLILEQMQVPPPSDRLQYATWSLLLTQARYKNYVTQSSDSLINIAYDYFIKQDDPQRKALSLYLKGALYAEWGDVDKALPHLLNAAEEVEKTSDYQLGHLIHLEIGSIYVYRVLYEYAKEAFRRSLEYAEFSGNKVYIASALLHIARIHSLIESYEESIPYYKEAINAAKLSKKPNTISSAVGELAAIYRECGNYSLALQHAYKALSINIKENLPKEQDYLDIGDIYNRLGVRDSAYYYLKQSIHTDNIYTKRSAYRVLYNLAKEEKNYEKALEYGDQYRFYADSIQRVDRSSTLIEM